MHLVNASDWLSNAQDACFSVQPNPPLSAQACRGDYRAFAWVMINRDNAIIAGRDHFGLEPFYYYYDAKQFVFGSTIPDIIQCLSTKPPLNPQRCIRECFSRHAAHYTPYDRVTFYDGIYRLTPGHVLTLKGGQLAEQSYWSLDLTATPLHYRDPRDYHAHFAQLLDEAVHFHGTGDHVAAELSGGLDSSMLLTACQRANRQLHYFTHAQAAACEEHVHLQSLIKRFDLQAQHHTIDARDFELFKVMRWCSERFAGAPPYLFFMLANTLHQAVAASGMKVLLSGFGGDECVSGYVPMRAYLPQALREQPYRHIWRELQLHQEHTTGSMHSPLAKLRALLTHAHPTLYQHLTRAGAKGCLPYCPTVKHYEYALLQGAHCHPLRMRIEYSAVIAKKLGFQYRYPLLYPPLVEFCFNLPLSQKRSQGMSRYLVRHYLQQHGATVTSKALKMTGSICGATLTKCLTAMAAGSFDQAGNAPAFQNYWQTDNSEHEQLIERIFSYMFTGYPVNTYG